MKVNTNKTKVMISGEWQKIMQDGHVVSVIEVLVIIQHHVIVVSSGYRRNVVV